MNDKKAFSRNNVTKYGEFVCSAFEWLPVYKQKEKAKKLEQITREDFEEVEI